MALGTVGALVAGTVASSAIGAVSSNRAADAQVDAAENADETQRYIFDRTVELTDPQRQAGLNALAIMNGAMGIGEMPAFSANGELLRAQGDGAGGYVVQYQDGNDWANSNNNFSTLDEAKNFLSSRRAGFTETPGYQFTLDEGMKALERQQAARGMRFSGEAAQEAMRYGTGLASQEYGDYYNRLAGIAGFGQTATNTQANAGTNYANAVGQNALYAGNARASGYSGVNDALQGGINNGFNLLGMYQSGMFS